jgi:tetratricopeptide (TPR) repeat protein
MGKKVLKNIPNIYLMEIGKLVPEVTDDLEETVKQGIFTLDRYRLYESVRKVFETGERDKILVIDNIQWIDNESIEVLKYLIRAFKAESIVLILVYRREEEMEMLTEFLKFASREIKTIEITLEPFHSKEILNFVRSIISEYPEKELVEYIERESGGNPYFIEELMKELAGKRYLSIKGEIWSFIRPIKELIPKTISDVTMRKYEQLNKEAQEILEIASVLGWFDTETIGELTGFNEGHIIGLMETISRLGLTQRRENRIEFSDGMSGEAIYTRTMQELKRKKLHAKIAEILERKYKDREYEVSDELAYHFYHARNNEKGYNYCIQAAKHAKDKYANSDAIRYYSWAEEFLGEKRENIEKRKECIIGRINIFIHIGEFDKAKDEIESGIKIVKKFHDRKFEATLRYQKSQIYCNEGENRKSVREAEKSLSICKKLGEKDISKELNMIAIGYLEMGEYRKALELFEKSLSVAESNEDRVGMTSILNNIGIIHFYKGELQDALCIFKKALKIAQSVQYRLFEANIIGNIGNVLGDLGDRRTAIQKYYNALKIMKVIGHRSGQLAFLYNCGHTNISLGEYKKAVQFLEKTLRFSHELGNKIQESFALNNLGFIKYCYGDYQEAMKLYGEASLIAEQAGGDREKIISKYNYIRLYIELGDYTRAKQYIDTAYSLSKNISSPALQFEILLLQLEYYIETNERKHIEKMVKEIDKRIDSMVIIDFKCSYNKLMGRLYLLKEDYERAFQYFSKALQMYEEIKEPFNVGKIRYYLGKLECGRGNMPESKEHIKESINIFNRLGVQGWEEKAKEFYNSL